MTTSTASMGTETATQITLPATMKAATRSKYGFAEVIELHDIEMPKPSGNEVLVKVCASSINKADWYTMAGKPLLFRAQLGWTKPKQVRLGTDLAGIVAAVGPDATKFSVGDRVFGELFEKSYGSYAEFVIADQAQLVKLPQTVSMNDAATLPLAGCTAVQALKDKGNIQPGQRVMICGASGSVGTFLIQLAKHWGAEITAVCSTRNIEQSKALGADFVIDYTKEDFAKSGKQFDLVIAANGDRKLRDYKRCLKPNGKLVALGGTMKQIFGIMLAAPFHTRKNGRQFGILSAKPKAADLELLAALVSSGDIKPCIEKHYPLDQIAGAMKYFEQGHARGKLVIEIASEQ